MILYKYRRKEHYMWLNGLEGLYSYTERGTVWNHIRNRELHPTKNRIKIRGKCYYVSKKLHKSQNNNISLFDLLGV